MSCSPNKKSGLIIGGPTLISRTRHQVNEKGIPDLPLIVSNTIPLVTLGQEVSPKNKKTHDRRSPQPKFQKLSSAIEIENIHKIEARIKNPLPTNQSDICEDMDYLRLNKKDSTGGPAD